VSFRAAIAAGLVLAAVGASAQETGTTTRPGRDVSLSSSEVRDTFFAYILGIIVSGAEAEIDNEQMRDILVEFKSPLDLPFDLISLVSQHTDPQTGERRIGLEFRHDVVIPVPFSLLFYHPGSITLTQRVSFDVHQSIRADPGEGEDAAPQDASVYDLVLAEGSILVDIDDWLEALFSSLEDAWIRHIVFFRWRHDWVCMLEGSGRTTHRVLRAYFDLTKNTIIFPVPESLHVVGKEIVPSAPAGP
jgi:hypothetical protein